MRSLHIRGVFVVAALCAAAAPAGAQTSWFAATLAGDRAVGNPGDEDGWGAAALGLGEGTAWYYIWVTDVDMPTASHVHTGSRGANGGIHVDLQASFAEVEDRTWVAHGAVQVDPGAAAAILDNPGGFYVNVHNADHPAGAVRGQVLGDGAARLALATTLRGDRAVGADGDPDGDGFVLTVFDDATAYFYCNAQGVAQPTAAHIHRGNALESGPVVVDAAVTFSDGVSVSQVEVDDDLGREILASPEGYYFNVHNGDYPAGAIRGQLRSSETVVHFPVISRTSGQAGSEWRTAVRVLGLIDESTTVVAEWYPANQAGLGAPAAVVPIPIEAGALAIINDAVADLFAADGNGALKLASAQPFASAARIFNDQRDNPAIGGTFGQAVPAYGDHMSLRSGALLLGSNRPPEDAAGSRSNLGYFNPGATTVTLDVAVHSATGELLGANRTTVAPFANAVQSLFSMVPAVPHDQRVADDLVVTFSASEPLLVYLSVVDNVTNDPVFVVPEVAPAVVTPSGVPTALY